MYPNMPTDNTALKIIQECLIKNSNNIDMFGLDIGHIMAILKFILQNTYVTYKDNHYIQKFGIGTGLHTSCSYSEIIVDDTYIKAIAMTTNNTPLSLSNYVDDSLIIWSGTPESFQIFKNNINSIWHTLNFEEEIETEKGITFLDMVIKRDTDNKIMYTFHQKPTHSGHYLHFTSHCSMNVKTNIIKTEASRITKNCSNKNDIWPYLEKLKSDLLNSGYPEHIVNSNILEGIKAHTKNPKNKKSYDYIWRVPYLNEGFTRIVKNIIKKSEINARIVITPGKSIKSTIKPHKSRFCNSKE